MLALDVLTDILLALDVKGLLRCKSVCKSWYSLISSPYFVNLHLKFIRNKEGKNNKQLGNRRIHAGYYCYTSNIEGSSDGLVCISSIMHSKICLSNPSTREFRILPDPIIYPNFNNGWHTLCYGFGYDSSTDDYKHVMAIDDRGSHDGTLVQILSLKSNVWKLFGHINYKLPYSKPGILLNGALHWFWFDSNYKDEIMSFDLAKEEFREIPQPEDRRYDGSYSNTLGIFDDHLCMINVPGGRPSGIWVMRNYNVKQSWELLPTFCEMRDRVHYMNKDFRLSRKMTSYFCFDALLSSSGRHMSDPIFVETLVSPYVNDNERNKEKRKRLMTQEIVGEGGKKKRTRNKNKPER